MWGRAVALRRAMWLIGGVVTSCVLLIYALTPPPVLMARNAVHDGYQRIAPRPYDPDAPVHVIDIDESSLKTLGQWPWPRTYLAALTDRLFSLGAVAVGYDILLSEPDRTSPRALRDNLTRFTPEADLPDGFENLPDHDTALARTLAAGPTVLALSGSDGGLVPPPKAGITHTGADPKEALLRYPGALTPLPGLARAAAGLGNISLPAGNDGITRIVPMIVGLGAETYPSLSAELLRVAQGEGSHVVRTTQASGEGAGGTNRVVAMKTGGAIYPLNGSGGFRVYFAGQQPGRMTSVGALLRDDWENAANRAAIAGRIILVGASAQALFDIRATPLGTQVPGVVVHAEVLEQIAAGQFLTRADWMPGLELLLIAAFGLIMTVVARTEAPVAGILTALTLAVLCWTGGWQAFARYGLLFDPVGPVIAAFAVFIPTTTMTVLAKDYARRKIRGQFAHFLPEPLIAEIVQSPEDTLTPKGSEREMTIMFVDMRRFSTLTEKMAPEDVVRLLNTFLDRISQALVAHGATIDKYIGDAVMAFWNAPVPRTDHASQAQRAIFAVEAAVEAANLELDTANLPQVEARIGVNTGAAFVGLMGSSERLSYSCVGDSVTLAARLEGLTRIYGVRHLVGEATVADCPAEYIPVPVDRVVVKGRTQPEGVFVLIPADDPKLTDFKAFMSTLQEALGRADWKAARSSAENLSRLTMAQIDTATLAQLYVDRIARAESTGQSEGFESYSAETKR